MPTFRKESRRRSFEISAIPRKQLLHALQRWPNRGPPLLAKCLLPLKLPANTRGWHIKIRNLFGLQNQSKTVKDAHFRLPFFALSNALASGSTLLQWSPRARLGLNLDPSPFHARNLYLVLSLTTGLVSVQFHCSFDDFFETVEYGGTDASYASITSSWKQLEGFMHVTGILTEEALQTHQSSDITTASTSSMPVQEFLDQDPTYDYAGFDPVFENLDDPTKEPEAAPTEGGTSSRGRHFPDGFL